MTGTVPQVNTWVNRIRGEYLEMPGLSLTERQAGRLWGLESGTCRALLETLARIGFLYRNDRGEYVRSGCSL